MNEGANIQHKAAFSTPSGFGFDDAGECVPLAPECSPLDEIAKETGYDAKTAIAMILLSVWKLKPLQAGYKILTLAYLAGQTDFKTDAEFARHLGVSASRASRILREYAIGARVR